MNANFNSDADHNRTDINDAITTTVPILRTAQHHQQQLLDDLDTEITHAEETDLMNKYHTILQRNVQRETRGQHKRRFHAMIKDRRNKNKIKDISVRKEKRQGIQHQHQQQQHQIATMVSQKSAILIDNDNEGFCTLEINDCNNSYHSGKQRRPRFHLFSEENIGTTAIVRDSIETIHDLQLVRATVLLPRIYTRKDRNKRTNNNNNNSNNDSNVVEWNTKELERYLYTKFSKMCQQHSKYQHASVGTTTTKTTKWNNGTASNNIYWKHFDLSLQSANSTSWRCIIVGYRRMVQDAFVFVQSLRLGRHHRKSTTNNNYNISTTSCSATSSVASLTST